MQTGRKYISKFVVLSNNLMIINESVKEEQLFPDTVIKILP